MSFLAVSQILVLAALVVLAVSVVGPMPGALRVPKETPLVLAAVLLLAAFGVAAVGARRARRRAVLVEAHLARHAQRQEVLAELSQLALTDASNAVVAERVVALLRSTFDADLVGFWELEGASLRLRAGFGCREQRPDEVTTADAATPLGGVLLTHEPLLLESIPSATRQALPVALRSLAISSLAACSVRGPERPLGILAVGFKRSRAIAPDEITFLQAVADVVASAIITRAHADELETSAVLARVGQELIASLDAPVLVSRICQLTAEVLAADHSSTWLLQPEEQIYVPIANHGLAADRWEVLRTITLPAASLRPFLDRVGRDGLVEVAATSTEYPLLAAMLSHMGVDRILFGALRHGGELIGLQATSYERSGDPLTPRREAVARGIAHLSSMAFTNARLIEELERANTLKSEFVSTMSHELRTPLNVIIGYTDMLHEDLDADEQAATLTRVRRSSVELLDMIEGTLDLNRMAAGRDAPCIEAVEIEELLHELQADFTAMPRRSTASLNWLPAPRATVYTDRRKLKIILKNLVGNALKFTPEGEVTVGAERDGVAFAFTVRDTGIGIARDQLPHVFEMFRQVDSSDARSYGGAGLGLYIVRTLLGQLGGEVSVESDPGDGSTFRVMLPAPEEDVGTLARSGHPGPNGKPQAVTTTATATATAAGQGSRRLIVFADDLPLNRLLLRRFFEREFAEVDAVEAVDGAQAVAMAEGLRPDLLLLDMRMPEMDGWQAARTIRRLACGRDVPIIAMSVNAAPGAEAVALAAGCNEFIAKPVSDYAPLKSRIEHWLAVTPRRVRADGKTDASTVCGLCRRPLEPPPVVASQI